MKNWINFTKTRTDKYDNKTHSLVECEPYQQAALGSFGNITFDGRYNIDTLIYLCDKYMITNKYDGYRIYSGEWLNESNLIYSKQ